MRGRLPWLLLAAVLVACAAIGLRGCGSGATENPAAANAPMAAPAPPASAAANTDANAREAARRRERDAALHAAVATLQRYLAALGGDDRAAADAFWAGGKPPRDTHEADLRALHELRGLRIENGMPRALDSESVPLALEIPVELRAGFADAPLRRYRGWYRLRRAVDGRWEITSASVEVAPARR